MKAVVEVLGFAAGGHCVARHEGKAIFIRGVLPGEIIEVDIPDRFENSRYAHAELISIISRSADRKEPPCKYFGACGGCDWQHLDVAGQIDMHHKVIHDQMRRIGKLTNLEILPIRSVDSESGWHYRTQMRFAVSAAGKVALRKHSSNDLIEIDKCLIATEAINSKINQKWPANVELNIADNGQQVVAVTNSASGEFISYQNQFGSWRAPLNGFWQSHRAAPELLITEVLANLNVVSGDKILDLYAGVGLFSIPLAQRVGEIGEVISVESDEDASRCAAENLITYGWAKSVRSDVAEFLKRDLSSNKAVVDPPRSGLNKTVIDRLNAMASLQTICYISCDAGSLARDLAEFDRLGWHIGALQPLLLFPMTSHIETVVTLTKLR